MFLRLIISLEVKVFVKLYTMISKSWTVYDLLSCNKDHMHVNPEIVLPFIILPVLLLIASFSKVTTVIIMLMIVMGVLYVSSRPHKKNGSPFFFSWTLASATYLFLIFECGVMSLLEITQLENFIVLALTASTCYFFYKVRAIANFELLGPSKGKDYSPVLTSDSSYCYICQIEVNDRLFHSLWWDCCMFRLNYPYFVAGLMFAFAALSFGANLGLTTVCLPFILTPNILLPDDCSEVYYEYELAMYFVLCIYALGYAFAILVVLLQQIFIYIPKYFRMYFGKYRTVLTT